MTIEKFAFCASRDVRRKVLTKYPFFKYVLSTMGVSKESISKFLIGNRFHVKLRILSLYSNRFCLNKVWEWFYLNKDWGCVILREIDFLLKICWSLPCLHPPWKVHTWIEICASLNHRKKTKADGSRLIPRKHTETLVLLSVSFFQFHQRISFFGLTCYSVTVEQTPEIWPMLNFTLWSRQRLKPEASRALLSPKSDTWKNTRRRRPRHLGHDCVADPGLKKTLP